MLSDKDLVELTDFYISEAVQFIEDEISDDRIKAQEYFHAKPFGNEQKGRSQVVSTDVRDAIEWTLPTLLKIFFSSDHVIEFTPVGDEDVKPAAMLTELFDYVVTRKNAGFMIYYTWFKDALMKRNGFVTAYWVTEEHVEDASYQGLTQPEYELLKEDKNFRAYEVEEYEQLVDIPGVGQGLEMMMYDVKGEYTYEDSSIKIVNIPPEELFTLGSTRSCKDSRFWLHRSYQSVSALREQGYEVPDDASGQLLAIEGMSREEIYTRHRKGYDIVEELEAMDEVSMIDPSMKNVHFYQMDVMIDMDQSGKANWWRICRVDDYIVHKESILYPMYPTLTPVPAPHQLFGDGYYELIGKFQKLKSSLHRVLLDYIYYSTNPRAELSMQKWDSEFTLDDWMNNAPNSAVRVKEPGAVNPIYPAPLNPQVFSMLEYLEGERENAVGVTRYNSGQDATSLNQTASGISSIMSAAAGRIELVARIFAETGITQLADIIKDLLIEYPEETSKMVARLSNGKVTELDADSLRGSYDYVVTVGVGNADKTQILESILALFGLWEKFIQMGAGPMSEKQLVTWENMYQGMREFVKSAGLKNVSLYTHDPAIPPAEPPPEPPPSPQDVAAQMQAEYLKVEAEVKLREQQLNEYKVRAEVTLAQNELALKRLIETKKLELQEDKLDVDAMSKGVNDGRPTRTA